MADRDTSALSGWVSTGANQGWRAEVSRSARLTDLGHLSTFTNEGVETTVFGRLSARTALAARLDRAKLDLGSDAQVVSGLYQKEGLGVFDAISGDFAIVIIDRSHELVVLARNHAGTRPLFYAEDGDMIRFASDVGSLRNKSEQYQDADPQSIDAFLVGDPPPQGRTMANNVRSIPPAHYLAISAAVPSVVRYWHPSSVKQRQVKSTSIAAVELAALLSTVVDDLTPYCDGVGVHLTGGLDSSAVAALLVPVLASRGKKTPMAYAWQTQAVAGQVPDLDSQLIQQIGEHLSLEVSYVPLTLDRLLATLAIDPISQPTTSTLLTERPLMAVAEDHGVTHLVSGWGGDEFVSQNTPGKTTGLGRIRQVVARVVRRSRPVTARKRMLRHLERGHIHERTDSWSIHGAGHGIQYCFPLLDKQVIEFALSMPAHVHRPGRVLLREALKGLVPESIRLNTDKSEPGRSRDLLCLAESLRDQLGSLPLNPDRYEMVDRQRLAAARAVRGAVTQPGKFLRALQIAYDPDGIPYDELVDR